MGSERHGVLICLAMCDSNVIISGLFCWLSIAFFQYTVKLSEVFGRGKNPVN
jgi:hypothetical protein